MGFQSITAQSPTCTLPLYGRNWSLGWLSHLVEKREIVTPALTPGSSLNSALFLNAIGRWEIQTQAWHLNFDYYCNLPNQDSTRWMNSFDFLKKQTCFVGLKKSAYFLPLGGMIRVFFFLTLKRNPSFPLNARKHILHSWQTYVIFTAWNLTWGICL